jgi:hypothetical protein
MPGVRRYKPSVPRAKAVSPAPASQAGTTRQDQGRADGDLGRGQQAGELLGIELAEERIGSGGKAVELAGGGVVGATLGQPGVEEVGAGDQPWWQVPCLQA